MLDMDRLEAANAAMEETDLWLLDSAYRTVAKVAFNLWDYRFPRNFDTIDQNIYCELRNEVIISTYFEGGPNFSTDFEKEIENDD